MAAVQELQQAYKDNPKTDYHDATQERVFKISGVKIERRPIKNINFSLIYGVSLPTLHHKYLPELSDQQVKELMAAYYKGAPYAKSTMAAISQEVQTYGDGEHVSIYGNRTIKWRSPNGAVFHWTLRFLDTVITSNELMIIAEQITSSRARRQT